MSIICECGNKYADGTKYCLGCGRVMIDPELKSHIANSVRPIQREEFPQFKPDNPRILGKGTKPIHKKLLESDVITPEEFRREYQNEPPQYDESLKNGYEGLLIRGKGGYELKPGTLDCCPQCGSSNVEYKYSSTSPQNCNECNWQIEDNEAIATALETDPTPDQQELIENLKNNYCPYCSSYDVIHHHNSITWYSCKTCGAINQNHPDFKTCGICGTIDCKDLHRPSIQEQYKESFANIQYFIHRRYLIYCLDNNPRELDVGELREYGLRGGKKLKGILPEFHEGGIIKEINLLPKMKRGELVVKPTSPTEWTSIPPTSNIWGAKKPSKKRRPAKTRSIKKVNQKEDKEKNQKKSLDRIPKQPFESMAFRR